MCSSDLVRLLAQQAQQAFEGLQKLDQSGLDRITEALSRAGALHAAELAREACAETGFGNERDKTEKNRFAAVRVFEAIRGLRTVGILRKDDERRVWDVGVPVGVIAGIVPSTNPTSTVIYKSLIALKAAGVELAEFYAPPTETNFAGALLTGTRSACLAACTAFAEAVCEAAARPLEAEGTRRNDHGI